MTHPQVLPAAVELVKFQLHGAGPARDLVWGCRHRVFCEGRREWVGNSCGISSVGAQLVFRAAHQDGSHNPKKISPLPPELVFRQIPRKLPQRRRQAQRLHRLFLGATLLDAIPGRVIRVAGAPLRLRPAGAVSSGIRVDYRRVAALRLGGWDETSGGRSSRVFSGARASCIMIDMPCPPCGLARLTGASF